MEPSSVHVPGALGPGEMGNESPGEKPHSLRAFFSQCGAWTAEHQEALAESRARPAA